MHWLSVPRPIDLCAILFLTATGPLCCTARPQLDSANLVVLHYPTASVPMTSSTTSSSTSATATGNSSSSSSSSSNSGGLEYPGNYTLVVPSTITPAQCVSGLGFPAWLSLTGPIYARNCQDVLQTMMDALQKYNDTPYYFYSQQALPDGLDMPNSWALPVGAETEFTEGNCVATVRMRRDFVPAVLPITNASIYDNPLYKPTNRTYPPPGDPAAYRPVTGTVSSKIPTPTLLPVDTVPFQLATWGLIMAEFQNIITNCVATNRSSGFGLVGDIVVSFWARNSQIDQVLGMYSLGTPSRNPNVTSTTG